MAAEWYVRVDGQEYGPYTTEQLKTYAAEGHVTPTSEIRRGEGPWCAATQVKGMFPERTTAAPPPPPAPATVGRAPTAVAIGGSRSVESSADSPASEQLDSATPPTLPGGERILYQDAPAMFRNHPVGFLLCIILCVGVVGFLILLIWYLRCYGTQLTVTDKRTTLRTGILSKHVNEVFHRDVRNVRLSQTFGQRLLGVGSVELSSAGQSDVEIAVAGMPHPEQIKSLINEYRD